MTAHRKPVGVTPEQAATMICPASRTMAEAKAQRGCRGDECMAWRWNREVNIQSFAAAVKREQACLAQEDNKGKKPESFHNAAVKNVDKDPEAYGVDTQAETGFCGLAGPMLAVRG